MAKQKTKKIYKSEYSDTFLFLADGGKLPDNKQKAYSDSLNLYKKSKLNEDSIKAKGFKPVETVPLKSSAPYVPMVKKTKVDGLDITKEYNKNIRPIAEQRFAKSTPTGIDYTNTTSIPIYKKPTTPIEVPIVPPITYKDTTINNNPYVKSSLGQITPKFTPDQIKAKTDNISDTSGNKLPYGYDSININTPSGISDPNRIPVMAPNPVPLFPDVFKQGVPKHGWGSVIGGIAGTTLGSIVAPGVGSAIGGSIGSKLGGDIDQRKQENQIFDTQVSNQQLFCMGGKMNKYPMGGNSEYPNAEVEGGETMMAPNGETDNFNGPSHEQGGIPVNLTPGTMIFSDRIKDPNSKKTFAELAKKYPTDKFKEKADSKKSTQLEKSTAKLMFDRNTKKQEELFALQESLKQEKLNRSINRAMMKYGGKIDTYNRPSHGNHIFNYRYVFDQNNHKMMNWSKAEGGYIKYDGGGWIQKAINPKHKGYCTPMTKSTCTPHRKALAMTFKKHHGFHADGGTIDGKKNPYQAEIDAYKKARPWEFDAQGNPLMAGDWSVDPNSKEYAMKTLTPMKPLGPEGTNIPQERQPIYPQDSPSLDTAIIEANTPGQRPDYSNIGNQLLTAAPSIYDLGKGLFGRTNPLNPENFRTGRLSPRDNNIQASLREGRIQDAIMRANARGAGLTTGAYLGSAGQASSQTQQNISKIEQENQARNNAARTGVDTFNINMGATDNQMRLNILNQNAQDLAKKSEYLGKGLEGVSGLAQTNRLMKNQEGRDVLRTKSLNSMFRNFKLQPDGTWKNSRGETLTDEQYKALVRQ